MAGGVHVRVLEASRAWQIWVGVWALTVSTPTDEDDRVLGPALLAGHEKATEALRLVFDEIIGALGFRPRAPLKLEHLALTIGALAEGMALRDRFAAAPAATAVAVPPDDREWSLFGIAVDALVLRFVEPDDDWAPPQTRSH